MYGAGSSAGLGQGRRRPGGWPFLPDVGRRIRHDRGIDQAEHQSGVLIVGYSYGYFAARDLVRMGACLTVVEFLVLLTGPILLATDRP
jgi:hypothetical protein